MINLEILICLIDLKKYEPDNSVNKSMGMHVFINKLSMENQIKLRILWIDKLLLITRLTLFTNIYKGNVYEVNQ